MTTPEEALSVAQSLIGALERRDVDALIALLADDILLEVPFPLAAGENTTGTRYQRGAAVRAYVQDVKARTSEIRFRDVIWRTTNDGLALFQAEGDITLSDGRPYPNTYLMMFEVAHGKVVRWVEYLNPVAAVRAFGAPLESIP